jgi:methylated-DNA-[protein]-cysteine S-methyltransferase
MGDAGVSPLVYFRLETPVGEIFLYARKEQLIGVCFNRLPAEAWMGRSPLPQAVGEIAEAIESYFEGREIENRLAHSLLDDYPFTDFERGVLREVKRIPRGKTRSYLEVARLVGKGRAARAVGNVMRKNPFPIIIPCHRVIRSDGSLGGYGGGGAGQALAPGIRGSYLGRFRRGYSATLR